MYGAKHVYPNHYFVTVPGTVTIQRPMFNRGIENTRKCGVFYQFSWQSMAIVYTTILMSFGNNIDNPSLITLI